ncbi:MAG: DEAD/DEAH box helicase [Nevskiales bacterium]
MSFSQLGLMPALLDAVAHEGYTVPTPIQFQAIPAVLQGHDLLAAAQTGTGKTAAFVLPILQRLANQPAPGRRLPRVLVLTPTRELAAQIGESVRTYGRNLKIRSTCIFGGVGHAPQTSALRQGVDIVIATPGRLLDHMQQRNADLSAIEVLVLDEADRMLDMGFIRDIRRVLQKLPPQRQNLLFSATFSEDIRGLAKGLLRAPLEINVAPRNTPADTIRHRAVFVPQPHKRAMLTYLIRQGDWQQVLVFTRTKHGADRLCKLLERDQIACAALHGNKSQNARTRTLAEFKTGRLRVLVATDIASRGIDIDQLPHVVNYELPNVSEDYVHRIGRTGRAGIEGEALSLVAPEERGYFRDIQRLLKRDIEILQVQGFRPDAPDLAHPHSPAQPESQQRPQFEHHHRRGGHRPQQAQHHHRGHRTEHRAEPGNSSNDSSDRSRSRNGNSQGAQHAPAGRRPKPRRAWQHR